MPTGVFPRSAFWRMRVTEGRRAAIPPIEERFWSKVIKSEGCWTWSAAHDKDGYGLFNFIENGLRKCRAHRFVWTLTYGHIPEGLLVCHLCDTPSCVRPDHLFLGTVGDNNRDAFSKGRMINPVGYGEQNAHSRAVGKLTWVKVREIRRAYAAGEMNQPQLGKKFDVPVGNISLIINHKIWKER